MYRVGQNRIYTPYMTVYSVVFLPKIPYIYCIYMVLANSTYINMQPSLQPSRSLVVFFSALRCGLPPIHTREGKNSVRDWPEIKT